MKLRDRLIKLLGGVTMAQYEEALDARPDFEATRMGNLVVLQDRRYREAQRQISELSEQNNELGYECLRLQRELEQYRKPQTQMEPA
ncbi:hypothetical protein CAL26_21165 [Bordetella genomosp. 9]|uniref:Uncharacterized protein n=1 Tax=Bordetella genomosp. 9 TaxID=1416803 RepID=A0A261R5M2_9BORD|nr:hypothetical protein [Bordetella genomosp. 9]OZI20067.1 hypothetical protein CAL26_21165 [Bordetella genomosp. 9]